MRCGSVSRPFAVHRLALSYRLFTLTAGILIGVFVLSLDLVTQERVTMDHDHHAHHDHNSMGSSVPSAAPSLSVEALTNMDSHNDHNMNGHAGMDMMKMYFHFGVGETILFHDWKTTTVTGMVFSCIGIFFIAFAYEALKCYREYLFKKDQARLQYASVAGTGANGNTQGGTDNPLPQSQRQVVIRRIISAPHISQTALHIVQLVISYFLMLIFMTFNVWLCLAVVLGSGVGYFLFGWQKSTNIVDLSDHCG